jgi:hypothetical protein
VLFLFHTPGFILILKLKKQFIAHPKNISFK